MTLVSGPVTLSAPRGIDTVHVITAQQMFNAVQEHFTQADLTIMAAAVGDFRPIEQSSEKIKKNGRVNIDLRLTSNPDILAWAGAHKTAGQTLCGFAMETQDLESNAAKKLTSKHCSMLVANNLNTPRRIRGGYECGDRAETRRNHRRTDHRALEQDEQAGIGGTHPHRIGSVAQYRIR